MAEASISADQFSVDQFSCPVCLDLLQDPVTIPCGHSFCKVCINGCWDQEDQKGVYSCPQCRDTFTPRPVLRRNTMLAEVVEKLKKTELQAASPAHCYAGPGDVECDFCTGRKHKAIKSCLMCLASYCEIHIKPHLEVPALKKHTLIEASAKLQEKICSEHNEVLKIYCRTDQTCICYLCTMDNHKGHDTVTATAERAEKQSEVKEEQMKSQQRIQEKQKKVQELKQAVNTIKLSAQTAVEDSERIFTKLISSMEKKRSEVTELIRAQEKAELSRAERLLEQMEQEIADLQRRVTELEQLSHTHDHIQFLQALASGHPSPRHKRPDFHTSSITVHQHLSFDGVRNSLSDLKKRLEEFCEEEFNKIPPHAAAVQIISLPEPQSREDFLKWPAHVMPPKPGPADVMPATQEPLHKMAATQESRPIMAANPETLYKTAAIPEPRHDMAAAPESPAKMAAAPESPAITLEPRHVTAATPESRPIMSAMSELTVKMAATPEPCHAMATLPEPCHAMDAMQVSPKNFF
ncbi:hypothetical protein PGIGA_G00194840 [Pangasianodon gigas]|uniref:Uncharacterized protein n=1 Tax=Pangasianodon gigas TaxID=30993 RepID=A0ACC5XWY9_PANGG|nr:hypothetical protein [Pangasianodon gigas]